MEPNANKSEAEGDEKLCALKAAFQCNYDGLLDAISALVWKLWRPSRRSDVTERAQEILSETVEQVLQNYAKFDPDRSAVAWIMGFAVRVLKNRHRVEARHARVVRASEINDEVWQRVIDGLCCAASDDCTANQIDVTTAMSRLKPEDQRAIKCRYFEGLEGKELAAALGVSPCAARVRVCRALQALGAQLGPPDDWETS